MFPYVDVRRSNARPGRKAWPQGGLFGLRLGADEPGNDLSRPIRGDLETSFPQDAYASSDSHLFDEHDFLRSEPCNRNFSSKCALTMMKEASARLRPATYPVGLEPVHLLGTPTPSFTGGMDCRISMGLRIRRAVAPLQDPRHL